MPRRHLEVRPVRQALLGALALAGFLLVPSSIVAQKSEPVVKGVVQDSAGNPLEGAHVQLYGSPRFEATTGPDGAFQFSGARNARYWLLVRRIGFLPHQESLTLQDGEVRDALVTMQAAPVSLPEVVVKAAGSRYDRRMRDFMWRSRSSFGGHFLTRDDIARYDPARLGDLVIRYLPFKRSWTLDYPGGWGNNGLTGTVMDVGRFTRHRNYQPDCSPAVALNGGPVSLGVAVNDFQPENIEALEVYKEGSDLPIEYTFGNRTSCGLVVIWLRSYAQVTPDS